MMKTIVKASALALCFMLVSKTAGAEVSLLTTDYCGTSCFELIDVGRQYLQRERDEHGEIIASELTGIPSSVQFQLVTGPSEPMGAPEPPPEDGAVVRTEMASGTTLEGREGVWVASTTWFYAHGRLAHLKHHYFFSACGPAQSCGDGL